MIDTTASLSPIEVQTIKESIGLLELNNIIQLKANYWRGEAIDKDPKGSLKIEGGFGLEVQVFNDGKNAVATMTVNADAIPENPEFKDLPGFKIEATYRAFYSFKDENHSIDERNRVITLLVMSSSPQHIWPYWREFAQQVSTRMGVGPLIAPLIIAFNFPSATSIIQDNEKTKPSATQTKIIKKKSSQKLTKK